MPAKPFLPRLVAALPAIFIASASAQQPRKAPAGCEPSVGQEGKDVVRVPTPRALADKMRDMAGMAPRDFVMGLGSGGKEYRGRVSNGKLALRRGSGRSA